MMERTTLAPTDRWNIEALYESLGSWEKDYRQLKERAANNGWPQLQSFQGQLSDRKKLKEAIDLLLSESRELEKLYTYIHLRHDEEITEEKHKAAYQQITNDLYDFQQATAWVAPELLRMAPDEVDPLLSEPELSSYRFYLEKILRLRLHTLSPEQEELLSQAAKAQQAPQKAFGAINNADFQFGEVEDSEGKRHLLTHASYGLFLRKKDRVLRKNSFERLQGQYQAFANTLCELLQGVVQSHLFVARARHYSSSLEAALYPHQIDPSVYHNLIEAVDERLGSLHRYMELRKKWLGVDELFPYDLYIPLVEQPQREIPYEEAEQLVIDSVAPLGEEYQQLLAEGLLKQHWVDKFENKNKRSGAYSSGCYDSYPYILMNYKGSLRDLFTLAHEAGHSMHSLLSRRHQPYAYADYPIFLAEIASTFNEQLLMKLLLDRCQTAQEKAFLINEKIEEIRTTLLRQTLFAQFELFIHQCAEQNLPLTPALLCQEYQRLNGHYYGPALTLDPLLSMEWSRIPHFYYNFYVYQYATGLSASIALFEQVIQGTDQGGRRYLELLKAGGSDYPLPLLERAGLDMRSKQPIQRALERFSSLTTELEQLLPALEQKQKEGVRRGEATQN